MSFWMISPATLEPTELEVILSEKKFSTLYKEKIDFSWTVGSFSPSYTIHAYEG